MSTRLFLLLGVWRRVADGRRVVVVVGLDRGPAEEREAMRSRSRDW